MSLSTLSQFRQQLYKLLHLYNRANSGMDLIGTLSYSPDPTPGQKPVAVGYVYSLLPFLPEREEETGPAWAVSLDARRVATDEQEVQVAREQVSRWLQAQKQADPSFSAEQTMVARDSRYSMPDFISPLVMEAGTMG